MIREGPPGRERIWVEGLDEIFGLCYASAAALGTGRSLGPPGPQDRPSRLIAASRPSNLRPCASSSRRSSIPGGGWPSREGQVVFTDEGLPGELVEAEIVRDEKRII